MVYWASLYNTLPEKSNKEIKEEIKNILRQMKIATRLSKIYGTKKKKISFKREFYSNAGLPQKTRKNLNE